MGRQEGGARSAYLPPADRLGIVAGKLAAQYVVGRFFQEVVVLYDGGGYVAGQLQYLPVAGQIGNAQVEGNATLLRTLHVTGPPQAHIGFGDAEAVVGLYHNFEPLAGLLREVVTRHEYAIRLVGAAPYAPPELMELGKAETLGILDNHHRGIGNVHAYFYDCGCYHDLSLALDETLHLLLFLGGLHLPVYHTYVVLGEVGAHGFVSFYKIFHVALLALLDEWIYDICLPALLQLTPQGGIEIGPAIVVLQERVDGLPTGRQLVDDRYVEVAIDGHGKRTGYRGCRHDQHVGRNGVFLPQLGTLRHAEAVLFVDDNHAEVLEDDLLFEQGMSSYKEMYFAGFEAMQDRFTLAFPPRTGKQLRAQAEGGKPLRDALVMLCGKYLGRSHDAGLETVVDGHKSCHEGYHGLPAAYVALKEAIHLPAAAYIGANFTNHPFLRLGELEWKNLMIETVEILPYMGKEVPPDAAIAQTGIAQQVELQIEELLEFEPHLGTAKVFDIAGEMYVV